MELNNKILIAMSGDFFGGAEKMTLNLAQILKENSFDIYYIFNKDGETAKKVDNKSLKFIINQNSFISKNNILISFLNILKIFILLKKEKYKIVIVENKHLLQLITSISKYFRLKVYAYNHFPLSQYEVEKCGFNKADKIITCCKALQKYFLPPEDFQDKFITLYNYIEKLEVDKNFKLPIPSLNIDDQKILVNIGHISRVKNQKLFIEIIYNLKLRGHNIIGVIVGSARVKEKNYLQECYELVKKYDLENNIFFIGQIDNVFNILEKAYLLVHTSSMEGLPLVILEAMSMGIPIVASNVDGIPEAVIDQENGYIFEQDDLSGFVEKCQNLLVDIVEYHRQSEKSKIVYLESFTIENFKKCLIKIFSS